MDSLESLVKCMKSWDHGNSEFSKHTSDPERVQSPHHLGMCDEATPKEGRKRRVLATTRWLVTSLLQKGSIVLLLVWGLLTPEEVLLVLPSIAPYPRGLFGSSVKRGAK